MVTLSVCSVVVFSFSSSIPLYTDIVSEIVVFEGLSIPLYTDIVSEIVVFEGVKVYQSRYTLTLSLKLLCLKVLKCINPVIH